MPNNYLFTMMEFVFEAGQIALKYINDSHASLKEDASVITIADKEVSKLAHEKLESLLKTKEHILIEEEDPKKEKYLDQKLLNDTPYIWSIDPIDGTRLYANQIGLFGISIGLIKDLVPWAGVVYFPILKELFYCDGNDAFFIQNAFSNSEKRTKIIPINVEISDKSLFFLSDNFFKQFNWKYEDCRIFISACAVVNLCWPAIGRGCGSFDKSNLWDFAGAWPIFRKAGMELRNIYTGKVFNHLDVKNFSEEHTWRLQEYHIMSNQENFQILRNKIISK